MEAWRRRQPEEGEKKEWVIAGEGDSEDVFEL